MRKTAVSDTNKVTCPECSTPNEHHAPFCENCGYRLRRPATSREGHPGIIKAKPKKATSSRAGRISAPRSVLPETQPDRRPINMASATTTEPEGVPAISLSEGSITMAEEMDPNQDPTRTVLEGLEPVEPEMDEIPATPPSMDVMTVGAPGEDRNISTMVLASLWLVSTGALMLVTYYLTAQSDNITTIEVRASQHPIEIAAGPFLRGLDEQVRSFMLMTCQRVMEDRSHCDQETLLAGEYPQETVKLGDYMIDALEVSNKEYAKCVTSGKCEALQTRECKVYTSQGLQPGMRVPKNSLEPNMPVVCVTRSQAAAYCSWKNGRLPSHDEWEKAARGNDGKLFPWGDGWVNDVANWGEIDIVKSAISGRLDGYEWSAPPGSFPDGRSPFGVDDMGGNVAEWVAGDDQHDGFARGGSWASTPFDLRATGRMEIATSTVRADVGFRCVYSP